MKVRFKDKFKKGCKPFTINESGGILYRNGSYTQFFLMPNGDTVHPKMLELIDKKAEREEDGRVLSIKLLDSGYFLGDDGHIYAFHELDFDIPENKPEEKEKGKLNPHVYIKGVKGRGKEVLELLQQHGAVEKEREFTFENPDNYYYISPSTRDIDYFCNKESVIGNLIMTFCEEITLPEQPVKRRVFEVQEGKTECYQCPFNIKCRESSLADTVKCDYYNLATLEEITI